MILDATAGEMPPEDTEDNNRASDTTADAEGLENGANLGSNGNPQPGASSAKKNKPAEGPRQAGGDVPVLALDCAWCQTLPPTAQALAARAEAKKLGANTGASNSATAPAAEYRALMVLGSDACLTFWLFGARTLAGGKLDVKAAGRCPLPQPQVKLAWHQRSSTAFTTGFNSKVSAWAVTYHGQRPLQVAGSRRKKPTAKEYSFTLAQEPSAAAASAAVAGRKGGRAGGDAVGGASSSIATQARAHVLGSGGNRNFNNSSGASSGSAGHSEVVQAMCVIEYGEDLDTGEPTVLFAVLIMCIDAQTPLNENHASFLHRCTLRHLRNSLLAFYAYRGQDAHLHIYSQFLVHTPKHSCNCMCTFKIFPWFPPRMYAGHALQVMLLATAALDHQIHLWNLMPGDSSFLRWKQELKPRPRGGVKCLTFDQHQVRVQ